MLDAFVLLSAMRGIRDEYIMDTVTALGYSEERTKPRRFAQKRWSILLVAAILISLFTITAYAMGWFGLRERSFSTKPVYPQNESVHPVVPALSDPPEVVYYVSMNGFRDSPEYMANAEWAAFWWDYVRNTAIDYNSGYLDGADQQTVDTCQFYGVYDQTMKDKLGSIAEKYGLKLHTKQVTPIVIEDFYRAAGTGVFLTSPGKGGGYIYEDGSFKLEWETIESEPTVVDGEYIRYGVNFVLQRHMAGTMLPYQHTVENPENYEEWAYTTIHGDTVIMCCNKDRDELLVFFDQDGIFIELRSGGMFTALKDKAEMEAVADRVIFHELLKTDIDFSVVDHGPTVCKNPGSAAVRTDFLSSPEGQAANEYSYLKEAMRESSEGNPQLVNLQTSLAEKYGLRNFESMRMVCSQAEIEMGWYAGEGNELLSYEDFAALGYDFRIAEQFAPFYFADNGIISGTNGMEWNYIPAGAFCPLLMDPIAEDYTEQWFYQTHCGAVVWIAADFPETGRAPVILYRTGNGWLVGQGGWYRSAYELEARADEIDFTVFP